MIPQALKYGLENNASDVILSPGAKPCIKQYGEVQECEGFEILVKEKLDSAIMGMMTESQKKDFIYGKELDFAIEMKSGERFRVNAFTQRNGFAVVFRPIKAVIESFESLGLPSQVLHFTQKKHGLILVTGSVGSGKSTTLAALLDYINTTQRKHIITVEDPVEFIHKNKQSLIEQREVGVDTKTFSNGLQYALRQASDVIMVGEMRDLDTFRLALRAAETGNLVLATLHTSGAARTVSRIIDMFPGDEKEQIKQQLSDSLIGVVWQTLVKKSDNTGRVPACEVLVNTTNVSNMIRKGIVHQINGAIETGKKDGMFLMKDSLTKLFNEGVLSQDNYNNLANLVYYRD